VHHYAPAFTCGSLPICRDRKSLTIMLVEDLTKNRSGKTGQTEHLIAGQVTTGFKHLIEIVIDSVVTGCDSFIGV
jgi:hypothetical protein